MGATDNLQKFFTSFETLPRLVSDIALSIALAQQRMDVNYLNDLKAIVDTITPLLADGTKSDQFQALFKAIAPSRYQFTETVVEVRADMQLASGSQASVGVSVPFAVAVNASYTRRTASDYRASALVRTVLHAVSSDPATMQTLLAAAKEAPSAPLPNPSEAQKAIQEALNNFQKPKE